MGRGSGVGANGRVRAVEMRRARVRDVDLSSPGPRSRWHGGGETSSMLYK
jgi:hypothetical protein